MKKILFPFMGFLLLAGFARAQEDGAKLAKQAGKALSAYNIDPVANAAKLDEAKQKIDEALKMPDAQAQASAWLTKGDIYNTLLMKDMAQRMIPGNEKNPLMGDNDALEAFTGYKNAYENPNAKKYEKSDAVKGVAQVEGHLINIGVSKYESGQFEKSFISFQASLQAHDILAANSQKSVLDDKEQYDNQVYITGLAAQLAKKNDDALKYYNQLYAKGDAKAAIYEGLYTIKSESGDTEGAEKILAEGRTKYPEDTGLLFAEINVYLKKGKLDELTGSLKKAIEKEPTNIVLYVTLGNVYDNLYQRMSKEKNEAKANEYFEEAKIYYSKAMEIDPKNVDAVYSLGALYYNKAAVRTQELNAMPEDYSSAGLKKLQTAKDEVMTLFDQALPYFQTAESLDANDLNTLIALNEIYARKEDELSLEFKKRLDTVRGGGKNESSHFKK
jgi:tetratricopeptide (TPR) repeat protein